MAVNQIQGQQRMGPKPRKQERGRLVVVETVYLQPVDDQPKSVDNSYVGQVTSTEQPYGPRKVGVDIAWQPLDLGWIQEASVLVLKNEEGHFTHTNPTEAQRREAESKVLEWGVQVEDGVAIVGTIPAQQTMRITPVNLADFRVRCSAGPAKYSITLFPK